MVHLSLLLVLLSSLTGCATLTGSSTTTGSPTTVRDIRFFEQGPREGSLRQYQTRFDASRARYIAVELKLEHPASDRVVELPMTCRYVNADGHTVGEPKWTHRVEPSRTGSSTVGLLGRSKPGGWSPGIYRVECRVDGQLIAKGAFEVIGQTVARPTPGRESRTSSTPGPGPESSKSTTSSPPSNPAVPPSPADSALPPTQRRLALVIGNTKYPASPLRNPVNDATAMAALLRQHDFNVTLRLDANQHTMERSIQDFTRYVPPGSIGLFYFSGHGVQVDGYNYLLPIDGVFQEPSDAKYRAVSADWVLERMDDAGIDMKILILDACRDNPFGPGGTRSLKRGLGTMNTPKGSLIAYATSPGQTALDGKGRHSPYTSQLLRQIPVPKRPMELMFKAVREGVQRETKGQQTPWESSSMTGEFYFARR